MMESHTLIEREPPLAKHIQSGFTNIQALSVQLVDGVQSTWRSIGVDMGEFMFSGLKIKSPLAHIFLWIILFLIAFLFEATKLYIAMVQRDSNKLKYHQASMEKVQIIMKLHLTITALGHSVIGYLLMMAVMVYLHLLVPVVLGMMLGYFLFGIMQFRIHLQCFCGCIPKCTPECDEAGGDRCNTKQCDFQKCKKDMHERLEAEKKCAREIKSQIFNRMDEIELRQTNLQPELCHYEGQQQISSQSNSEHRKSLELFSCAHESLPKLSSKNLQLGQQQKSSPSYNDSQMPLEKQPKVSSKNLQPGQCLYEAQKQKSSHSYNDPRRSLECQPCVPESQLKVSSKNLQSGYYHYEGQNQKPSHSYSDLRRSLECHPCAHESLPESMNLQPDQSHYEGQQQKPSTSCSDLRSSLDKSPCGPENQSKVSSKNLRPEQNHYEDQQQKSSHSYTNPRKSLESHPCAHESLPEVSSKNLETDKYQYEAQQQTSSHSISDSRKPLETYPCSHESLPKLKDSSKNLQSEICHYEGEGQNSSNSDSDPQRSQERYPRAEGSFHKLSSNHESVFMVTPKTGSLPKLPSDFDQDEQHPEYFYICDQGHRHHYPEFCPHLMKN